MWIAVVPTLLLLLVSNLSHAFTVNEVLQRSYQEQHYDTLLLLRHSRQWECIQMEQVATASTWPLLRLSNEANFTLKSSQSTEMFALICLTGNGEVDTEQWRALAKNLNNMRHVRLLLLLQQAAAINEVPFDLLLKELFDITYYRRFPHVVLLLSEGSAFQLQPYEKDLWLPLHPNSSAPIFARQYNFHLFPAKVMPDQVPPLSMVYKDGKTNDLRLTGYMAKMVLEFANAHNISLKWERPLVIGDQMSLIVLRNMTLNGSLSLCMTLCGYELPNESGYYTYPVDLAKWFITVPCAQEVPTAKVYIMVWTSKMLAVLFASYCIFTLLDTCFGWLLTKQKFHWTNLLFNERMLSGIIGQPFKLNAHSMNSSRLAHAQLFLLGLIVSTLFAAHLKTLLTKRPRERMVSNLKELQDSHLSIYFSEGEQFYINLPTKGHFLGEIKSKIIFLKTGDFYKHRKGWNKSEAFSMTSTEWEFIKWQQDLFQQPVLCYHPGLVFRSVLLASLPLQSNSIFAEPMDTFIHRIHDTGLFLYWKQQSLRDFIALGELSLKDPYPREPFHDFKVGDLFWVWFSLASGLSLAFVTFLCELTMYRIVRKT